MKIYNPANFSKNGMFKNLDENIEFLLDTNRHEQLLLGTKIMYLVSPFRSDFN